MRKKGKVAAFVAAAAAVAGVAAPATAAAATGRDLAGPLASVALSSGSGQSVVDWNRELISILGTPEALLRGLGHRLAARGEWVLVAGVVERGAR